MQGSTTRVRGVIVLFACAAVAALVQGCDARNPVEAADAHPLAADAPGAFPPPPPVGLNAAFRPDSFAVQLGWAHDGTQLATEWRVQRREPGDSTWLGVTTAPGAGASFVDASFPVGSARTLEYRVLVCNGAGCGTSVTAAVEVPALTGPYGFTATPGTGGISLAWKHDDDMPGSWIYHVLRRTASTTFVPRVTTGPGARTYVDATAAPGQTYYYQVRALLPGTPPAGRYRHSPWSQEASATPGGSGAGGPPVARADSAWPTGGSGAALYGAVTPNGQPTTVRFQWGTTPSLAGATTTPGNDAGSGFAPVSASASLSGLAPGVAYYYRVIAGNPAGTDTSAILPLALGRPPSPRVQAAFTRPAYDVALSWSGGGATAFRVERRDAGGATWTTLADGLTASALRDAGFHPDTVHAFQYRITACNEFGCSAGEAQVTTAPLPLPTPFGAQVGVSEVRLSWAANGAPPSVFYQIRRRTPGSAFLPRVTTGAGAMAFTDRGVVTDSTYLYEIRALLPVPGQTGNRRSAWAGGVAVTPGVIGATPAVRTDSAYADAGGVVLVGTVDVRAGRTRAYFEVDDGPAMASPTRLDVGLPTGASGPTRVSLRLATVAGSEYFRAGAFDGAGSAHGATLRTRYVPPTQFGPPVLRARFDGPTYTVRLDWSTFPGATYQLTRIIPGRRRTFAASPGLMDNDFMIERPLLITYLVSACTPAGCAASDSVRVSTEALGAPGGLEAAPLDSTRMRLEWDDRGTGESGFTVERQTPGDNPQWWHRVGTTGATAFVDTGLRPGVLYLYRVRAHLDHAGTRRMSLPSEEVPATPPYGGGHLPPAATTVGMELTTWYPTLKATVSPNGWATDVWFDVSTSPSMENADSLSAGTLYGPSPVSVSVNATSLARGPTYYYRVRAASARGTATGSVRVFLFDRPPAPIDLRASLRASDWTLDLAYTARNAPVARMEVRIDSVEVEAPYPAPTDFTPSVVLVEVALCNGLGCGPEGSLSFSAPAFPRPLFTATTSPGRINLAWQDLSGATLARWDLLRRPVGTTTWTRLRHYSWATAYTDLNVVAGVTYEYSLILTIGPIYDGEEPRGPPSIRMTVTAQ